MLPFAIRQEGNSLVISQFQHNPIDAANGNPFNTTFLLTVESDPFRGESECEYDLEKFIEFARQIIELYEFRRSDAELSEICYGSQVSFHMDKTGHIQVSGKIFGRAMEHSLQFIFRIDQTSLKPFADEMKQAFRL